MLIAGNPATTGTLINKGDKAADAIVKGAGKVGGVCFTEDTLILTKDGYKIIKAIQINDEVYSENPDTGEKGFKKVTNVFVKETRELIHVFAGSEEIKTTATHPFWVEGKGWVVASELETGDSLRTSDEEFVNVDNISIEQLTKPMKVYNFEVADWHTYFVSNSKFFVHNACSMPKNFKDVLRLLKDNGFEIVSQNGSHVKL